MTHIIYELNDQILCLTFNRVDKHNAFDDQTLTELQGYLDKTQDNPDVRCLLLKANGRHFSAGADLTWMQRMAHYTEAENIADAGILAQLMYSLAHWPKPTIAAVHGNAMGGGAGLAAACDIVIAADTARFAFSEVKLGLIPAVISPYVIDAIGARAARWLFTSGEMITADRALALGLIQHCVPASELYHFALKYAHDLAHLPPTAVQEAKRLVQHVTNTPNDAKLRKYTAELIASIRVSPEGQAGLHAFLAK